MLSMLMTKREGQCERQAEREGGGGNLQQAQFTEQLVLSESHSLA